MRAISQNSRVPFSKGPHRRKRICDCPDKVLEWMVKHWMDSDFHCWAMMAQKLLAQRARQDREVAAEASLEEQADAILRNAGCGNLAGKKN